MAITLRELRRDVLRGLGDLKVLTATDDGSDVTFIDKVNLTGGFNAYAGRDVLFSAGTAANLGEQRYVVESSGSYRGIGFDYPLPAATVTGDECELINMRGTGYKFQDIADTINISIKSLGPNTLTTIAPSDETFAYGTGLVIPTEFVTVENVVRQDTGDAAQYHSIPRAKREYGEGWWVDRSTRQLFLTGDIGYRNTGASIKIWGLAPAPLLYADDDETDIDYQWLTADVQARLARAKYLRTPTPDTERLMYMLSQDADRLKAGAVRPRSAFSVLL